MWVRCRRWKRRGELFDADAFPESYAAFYFVGGGFGVGVVPGGSGVALAVDDDVVVAGGAFPTADGGFGCGLEKFFVDGVEGEVLVAFDYYAVVALGDDGVFPGGFWHLSLV